MLNIFLDANILYGDPCFEKEYNKALINRVNKLGGNLYVSDIVYDEMENNFKKQLQDINKKIDKIKKECKIPITINNINIQSEIERMKSIYRSYEENNKLIILQTKNELLPEVIKRSIERKKPFTEDKQEFRDCLIWLTYANEVEEKKLKNCFFITKNTSDFSKDGELHPDLEKDTRNIKFYRDIYQFLKSEKGILMNLEENNLGECYLDIQKDEIENNSELMQAIRYNIKDYLDNISGHDKRLMYNSIIDSISLDIIDIESIQVPFYDVSIENKKFDYFTEAVVRANVNVYVNYNSKKLKLKDSIIKLNVKIVLEKEIIEIVNNSTLNPTYEVDNNIKRFSVSYEDIQILDIDGKEFIEILIEDQSAKREDYELMLAERAEALEDYYRH